LLIHAASIKPGSEISSVVWDDGSKSTITIEYVGEDLDVTCKPSAQATTDDERRAFEPAPLRVDQQDLANLRTSLGNGIRRELRVSIKEKNIFFSIPHGRLLIEAYQQVVEASADIQDAVLGLWQHAVWITSEAPYLTDCNGKAVASCDASQVRMMGLELEGDSVPARKVIEAWARKSIQ
jgi:hypothetical protein